MTAQTNRELCIGMVKALDPRVNEIVCSMWDAGKTGTEISLALGDIGYKLSRSAVMGKVHRLRLRGVLKAKKPETDNKDNIVYLRKVKKKFIPDRKIKKENIEARVQKHAEKTVIVEDTGEGILLLEATMFQCRWIMDHKRDGQVVCCGQIEHKRSFCKKHFDICYIRVPPKRPHNQPSKPFTLHPTNWR